MAIDEKARNELIEQIVAEYTGKIEDTVLKRLLEKAKLMSDTLDSDYAQSLSSLAKIHKAQSDWVKNQNDLIKTLDAEIIANKEQLAKAKRETERNYQQETEYRKEIERLEKERTDRKNSLLIREMQNSGAMSDADMAYTDKLYGQLKSGKITQEQYDMKMGARYGADYDKDAANKFENYRQKQLGRADTIINMAEGSGYTGLKGAADAGISALSKAGPYGAIAAAILKVVKAGVENILSRMDSAYKMLSKAIQEGNQIMIDNKSAVDTRLQGLENQFGNDGSTFKDILSNLFEKSENSAFINNKKYIENISKLVENGVAYNLEERAFLMTVSDKIATTFDALDKNLTRLIRLQQADITTSQLGAEASLTEFFNKQFRDTSYLTDEYDSVNATLLEASAQMNIDQATSFMYSAQKWLGSLYSLGLSSGAVNTIAQGLALLSTGNVNQLGGNQQLQTMMAMAAQNAGLSYSSILTGGLDANSVDALLASMVKYLGQIANNTSGNQVVKSQWADILGLSVSDFRAISNLTQGDLDAILAQTNLGYSAAAGLTQDTLLSQKFVGRYSVQEQIKNIVDNYLLQHASSYVLDDTKAAYYMEQELYESLMGKGSAAEKFAIWLKNMGRLAETDFVEDFSQIYNLIANVGGLGSSNITGFEYIGPNSSDYYDIGAAAYAQYVNLTDPRARSGMLQGLINSGNYIPIYAGLSEQQSSQLNLASWGYSLYNQNRGQNFAGLTPNALGINADLTNLALYENPFIQSTSVSSTGGSTLAERVVTSFDNVQEAVESSANAVTSVNEETTDSMEKLYHALFEEQAVPIKVYIDGLSDELAEKIDVFYDKNNLDLSDAIANAISTNSSISSMISTIQYLKGV